MRIDVGKARKEFEALFNGLCGKHNRWTIWQDFVLFSAVAISNHVDKAHAAERDELYKSAMRKYGEERFRIPEMFAKMVLAIGGNADQDFLGDCFMRLGLSDSLHGQFFTPYHIAKMTASFATADRIAEKVLQFGCGVVIDPACGSGAMLIAQANKCAECGIKYRNDVLFVGQDIDRTTALMCYIQLSLMDCAGYVVTGDALTSKMVSGPELWLVPEGQDVWYTPGYFSKIWKQRRRHNA